MPRKEPTFEQLYAELEATVDKLEQGNLPLEESLALYERGMQLARQCSAQLDRAELRLVELAPAANELNGAQPFDSPENGEESD